MKCITFENNGKLYFERESGMLRIIPEEYAKKNPDEVMVWNGKRCENEPLSEDDPEYLEMVEMLKEYE